MEMERKKEKNGYMEIASTGIVIQFKFPSLFVPLAKKEERRKKKERKEKKRKEKKRKEEKRKKTEMEMERKNEKKMDTWKYHQQ
jgi:hypothetical protein